MRSWNSFFRFVPSPPPRGRGLGRGGERFTAATLLLTIFSLASSSLLFAQTPNRPSNKPANVRMADVRPIADERVIPPAPAASIEHPPRAS